MVSNLSQVLSNRLSRAVVVHFLEDVRPSISEEVEGWLSIECKHGEPVCGGHAVSEELDTVAWGSFGSLRGGQGELRNSLNDVLAATEDASVWGVMSGDELKQSRDTTRMGSLNSSDGHSISNGVESEVHVLLKEGLELVANKEPLWSIITIDSLPNNLLLAIGGQGLVLGSVQVLLVQEWLDTFIVEHDIII